MSYLSIPNLYRSQEVLLFKYLWATEKAHGTSAHIKFTCSASIAVTGSGDRYDLTFFSGGESHNKFKNLFDEPKLVENFLKLQQPEVIVYGEAYGGKQQGMSATYGKELKFIVFDVKINGLWLDVPNMEQVAHGLGFEVVPYEKIEATLEELDRVRDQPSEIAKRRGCGDDKLREGVVLRPLIELVKNDGERIIAKHKRDEFKERATPQKIVDPATLLVLQQANEISNEWCTEMRLSHILDKLQPKATEMQDTPRVIKAMVEDIYREAKGEIVESKEATTAIGKRTAQLYKARVQTVIK